MSEFERIETIPGAKRTLQALRKLGYDFNSAVGDVVDNSIAAGASKIQIAFGRRGAHFYLSIQDNGRGMTPPQLKEAMRHGADVVYEKHSLSKFGMGLKTASLSQCRRLQVISNSSGVPGGVSSCIWDLSHVERTDRWEILSLAREKLAKDPNAKILRNSVGTLVLWNEVDLLDRELASFSREGSANNWVGALIADLQLYLGMTFGRFIDGKNEKGKKVKFEFNDKPLKSWDPFCLSEKDTRKLKSASFAPLKEHATATVHLTSYVLPEKEGFSTPEAWERGRGLLHWNDSQGLYIFRNDRLIHYGGWLHTRGKSEHTKYARISVDVDERLDEIFEIDVQKHKLRLPEAVRDFIVENTSEACRIAKTRSEKRRPASQGVNRGGNETGDEVFPKAMKTHGIATGPHGPAAVKVVNRKGATIYPNLRKFDYDSWVEPGIVQDGRLWELVPMLNNRFKVILNSEHPFYSKVYESGNTTLIKYIDCMITSVAYTELRTRTPQNENIHREMRDTVSEMLRRMATADSFKRMQKRKKGEK